MRCVYQSGIDGVVTFKLMRWEERVWLNARSSAIRASVCETVSISLVSPEVSISVIEARRLRAETKRERLVFKMSHQASCFIASALSQSEATVLSPVADTWQRNP
jgi:hypothetical protein